MNPSVKKIILVSFANQPGGVARHIRSIVSHLHGQELYFKVLICSKDERAVCEAITCGGAVNSKDIICIPHTQKIFIFSFIMALVNIFRREQVDIVDAFDDQTQVLAGVAARIAGIKSFLCHIDGQFSPATVSKPKKMLYWLINLFLNGYFYRTIVISQGLARELVTYGLRPKGKVEVLNSGIEILQATGTVPVLSGLERGVPVIGAVSRMSVEKGLDRFIQAAEIIVKNIPRSRFIICGDGPEKEKLMLLVKGLSLEGRFEFRPWTQDVAGIMCSFDIYVLPSLREGIPTTLLEAMSMGRPSIASDIEGVREVIHNGVDGILVDTVDPQAFARAIIKLCRDIPGAVDMGRRGLQKVRTAFHVEREMARLREIYAEICCKGDV